MELKIYLTILWRRKWIIAATTVITTVTVLIGLFIATPIYAASVTLRIATTNQGGASSTGPFNDRILNTYSNIALSRPALEAVAFQLGLELPPIADRTTPGLGLLSFKNLVPGSSLEQPPVITLEPVARTELLIITVEDQDPILAEEVANTLAEVVIVEGRRDKEIQGNIVSIVEPAITPEVPSKPRWGLNIALGIIVGLAGGLGLAFLFENLDTKLYTVEQIEGATELTVLGQIPVATGQQPMAFLNGNSPQEEAFRSLRTNLFSLDQTTSLQTLLITSAEPEEGKSTVVANLACAMAQLGRKVIVVDCDLRLPTLHRIFDVANEKGLSNLLKQEVSLAEVVQDSNIAGVSVLISGPLPPNPAELLGSTQMTDLIEQLKQQFDTVLLDAPALLTVTDATILALVVDGVLLVVGRAQARQESLRAVRRQLATVKARPIGVVVNRAAQDGGYDFNY